jgi:hypothetical protein
MLQFFMQYSVKSLIWLEVDFLVKEVLVSWLNTKSMFDRDAHVYTYYWHLVYCMLLICHLYFITTMFMREETKWNYDP